MGKKTKIALTGSLTMLAAGIGSLFYAGNYLYNLALNKQATSSGLNFLILTGFVWTLPTV